MLPELESRGVRLVAVSPERAKGLEKLRSRRKLSFPIVVDKGNEIAASFGIRHGFGDALREVYESLGILLEEVNGEPSWTLPMPARFIVDGEGVIRHVAADPDYTERPEPSGLPRLLDDLLR